MCILVVKPTCSYCLNPDERMTCRIVDYNWICSCIDDPNEVKHLQQLDMWDREEDICHCCKVCKYTKPVRVESYHYRDWSWRNPAPGEAVYCCRCRSLIQYHYAKDSFEYTSFSLAKIHSILKEIDDEGNKLNFAHLPNFEDMESSDDSSGCSSWSSSGDMLTENFSSLRL
jgi:hypothetical protein